MDIIQQLKAELDQRDQAIQDRLAEVDKVKTENENLRERIEEIEARGSTPGRTGTRVSAEVKGFEHYVRTGKTDQLVTDAKAMSIAGGAAEGAAMVPKVIAAEIIAKAIALSPLANLVRVTPSGTSDYRRILNLRGATASWSSETGTRQATNTPLQREVTFPHGELYALPSVTNWLLQDSQFNVESFLQQNVSDTFSKSLEIAILAGSGSDQPKGLLTETPLAIADDGSPARGQDVLEIVPLEGSPVDLANSIIGLYFSLKPEYRARGRWVMTSAQLATVRKLRDPNGSGFLWQQNLSAGVDASDGQLLGRPVHIAEHLGNVGIGSPAQNVIMFGDFQQGYELVPIGPMLVIRDQVTVKGSTILYTAQRFGGRTLDEDAVKVMAVN